MQENDSPVEPVHLDPALFGIHLELAVNEIGGCRFGFDRIVRGRPRAQRVGLGIVPPIKRLQDFVRRHERGLDAGRFQNGLGLLHLLGQHVDGGVPLLLRHIRGLVHRQLERVSKEIRHAPGPVFPGAQLAMPLDSFRVLDNRLDADEEVTGVATKLIRGGLFPVMLPDVPLELRQQRVALGHRQQVVVQQFVVLVVADRQKLQARFTVAHDCHLVEHAAEGVVQLVGLLA